MTRFGFPAVALFAVSLFAVSAVADDVRPIPNAVKYKESGVPNARGRSGSAAIEARALLDRNHAGTIEVTTGTFDDGPAAGAIERLLVRQADGAARTFHSPAAATVSESMTGLARGEAIEVQATVSGVDGARTDVVTVSEVVKLRPDLMVAPADVQPRGTIGLPVPVKALVRELNTDSGARANCVLLADGAEVDRAEDIWVDAGGTVTCEFAPSFTSPGKKDLEVVVETVSPADYDVANNRAEATTWIYDPADELSEWTASARDENFRHEERHTSPNSTSINFIDGWTTTSGFTANQRQALDVATLRLSFRLISDGETIEEVADQPFVPAGSRDPFSTCGRIAASSTRATVCAKHYPEAFGIPPYAQLSISTNGGDVTYYAEEWSHWFDENGQEQFYTWNSSNHATTGMQARFGSTMAMDVSLTGGAHTFFATPSLPMTPYADQSEQVNCTADGWCDEVRIRHHGVFGTDSRD
jgi:hypothetical protein